jgi:hypothetical protein
MRVGTKSLLFGVHQVFIHPVFVAKAWIRLYGVSLDPRVWLCFVVHDWGYFGCRDMDGEDGERHVELGARIASIFGDEWRDFCLYHSRFHAKKAGRPFSRLCVADKAAIYETPKWLYLFLGGLSGEIKEYLALAGDQSSKYRGMNMETSDIDRWYESMCVYLRGWVSAHKDGAEDKWTPKN